MPGGLVAGASERLEKCDPELAQVADLARIAFQTAAPIRDPRGIEQVYAPLLGVDAMLAQNERPAGVPMQERAKQPGVTRGHRVIAARRHKLPGDGREPPDRQVHVAHRPEIIDERRVRAALLIGLGDVREAVLAVQEFRERDASVAIGIKGQVAQGLGPKRPVFLT
nr:hypothetical protein [Acidiferrobacter sp. SPIII_3]